MGNVVAGCCNYWFYLANGSTGFILLMVMLWLVVVITGFILLMVMLWLVVVIIGVILLMVMLWKRPTESDFSPSLHHILTLSGRLFRPPLSGRRYHANVIRSTLSGCYQANTIRPTLSG